MIGDAHNYTYQPRTDFIRPSGRINMTPPISPFTQDHATMLNTPHEIRRHDISLSMPPSTSYQAYQPRDAYIHPRFDMTPPISVFSQDHAAKLNTPHEPRRHEISLSMPPQTFHHAYQPRDEYIHPRFDMTQISRFAQDHEAMLNTPHEIRRHEISLSMPPQTFSPAGGVGRGRDFSSGSTTRHSQSQRSTVPASSSEYHDDPSAALLALNFDDSDARVCESVPLSVVPAHNAAKIDAMGSTFLDILAANRINARQYSLLCSTKKMDTGSRNALIEQLYHVEKRLTPEQYAVMRE